MPVRYCVCAEFRPVCEMSRYQECVQSGSARTAWLQGYNCYNTKVRTHACVCARDRFPRSGQRLFAGASSPGAGQIDDSSAQPPLGEEAGSAAGTLPSLIAHAVVTDRGCKAHAATCGRPAPHMQACFGPVIANRLWPANDSVYNTTFYNASGSYPPLFARYSASSRTTFNTKARARGLRMVAPRVQTLPEYFA